ncbi:histone-lysine N-methyltransferase SETDB2 [Mugil cephalus]|uniref:histone-lysine N-methyltransferase SETDB2 n=1 Tax=Mugil cephalus TaxID=48193 RepID=UPI001FB62E2F|nr:histone-lysine N-methyltransferase SETDB2 [Mugil cephalus]
MELDPGDVDRAKAFWADEDVDQVFGRVLVYLDHLKRVLERSTASDKEYVQAMKLLEALDCSSSTSTTTTTTSSSSSPPPQEQDSSVVQVVIGSDAPLHTLHSTSSSSSSSSAAPINGPCCSAAPPADREELLPPLVPVQLQYQLHSCSKACLSGLPSMPQCSSLFWAQNPLKLPLLCGFKRLSAVPRGGAWDAEEEEQEEEQQEEQEEDWDVIYKAPCGQSLRNYDDVMQFLLATESYDVLQVDFFTFNPVVRLDPPQVGGPRSPEQDLSRGAEPTPVELIVGEDGLRPPDFRYRKDRWPHGCFLGREAEPFAVCCDCTDGCTDAARCRCVAMTTGPHYRHHRLQEAGPAGLVECGPWCDCDRSRCQNRLVQRGIRIRLQVFRTEDRGWGVRCRDDVDRGTFVCIYAGVVLQRVLTPTELPPPKLARVDLPSDDEVEVVTEWLAPPVLEGRSNLLETPPTLSPPTSPPLHVPVIQRPSDQAAAVGAEPAPPTGDQPQHGDQKVTVATEPRGVNGTQEGRGLKRAASWGEVCVVDASKEGNVSRFINHSCRPNLFLQDVYTDSHDPGYPVIAFFTSRALKAGSELTWDYASFSASSSHHQEVPCLCGSNGCRGRFTIEENLCDMCEVEGHNL